MQTNKVTISFNKKALSISYSAESRSDKWLICLHGIQSNKELFSDIFLDNRLNDYSILALDFIGFGDSDKPQDFSYDLLDQAKITVLVLDELSIKNFYLLGHSLGGMVGTLLLSMSQNNIKGFINCEGNLSIEDAGLSKDIVSKDYEEFKLHDYDQIKKNIKDSNEPSAILRTKWLQLTPDYAMYKICQSIIKWSEDVSFDDRFFNAKVPRLYIYGDKNIDKANRVVDSIEKAAVFNSGHFMFIDNPEGTLNAIEAFVE